MITRTELYRLKYMGICNKMANLRKAKGYAQIDLSRLTNLSQQYISRVERGIIIFFFTKAIKIEEALGECHCNVFFKCDKL